MPRIYENSSTGTIQPYLDAISRTRTLTAVEEARLAARVRCGDAAALCDLVRANLRFVVNVARSYQNQGLPLADLVSEGNLGMIRAAHRFDERKNFKFITYAVWWIRQAMLKALADHSRIVSLPLNRVGALYRINRAQAQLEQRLGRSPTEGEVAADLGMRADDVAGTLRAGAAALSLNAPLADEGGDTLAELVQYPDQEMADDAAQAESSRREMARTLGDLSAREQEILRLSYGIDGEEPYTLEEIGARLHLTRERTRQLRHRALMRLRRTTARPSTPPQRGGRPSTGRLAR
jgi:RNA polymerase primary sigma factor